MKGRYEFESENSYNEYLRAYYAGMALQGYLVSYAQEGWTNTDAYVGHSAEMAIKYADALLKELHKSKRKS